MCPYNETMKVFLSNLKDNDKEIVLVDFAAWSEASTKWIIASFDNLIIPLEPNLKMDIKKEIDLENKIIKNNFSPIIENILKMWIDKEKLERLKNLDDLKLWKKCH